MTSNGQKVVTKPAQARHTILLVQFKPEKSSRQWSDYDSVPLCMDGVCELFEAVLKRSKPDEAKITYDISDLFAFIDKLSDMSAMVFNPESNEYTPRGKTWIKDSVLAHLKKKAGLS